LTVTSRYLDSGNQAPGCGWAGDFTDMRFYSVNTCPQSNIWREASSVGGSVGWDCPFGPATMHTRTTAVAQVGTLQAVTANGCWRDWSGPEDNCGGDGERCI